MIVDEGAASNRVSVVLPHDLPIKVQVIDSTDAQEVRIQAPVLMSIYGRYTPLERLALNVPTNGCFDSSQYRDEIERKTRDQHSSVL